MLNREKKRLHDIKTATQAIYKGEIYNIEKTAAKRIVLRGPHGLVITSY